jgi:hypothetical protein
MMSCHQIRREDYETISVVIRASFILISMRAKEETKQWRDSPLHKESCKRQRIRAPLAENQSDQFFEMIAVSQEKMYVPGVTLIADVGNAIEHSPRANQTIHLQTMAWFECHIE